MCRDKGKDSSFFLQSWTAKVFSIDMSQYTIYTKNNSISILIKILQTNKTDDPEFKGSLILVRDLLEAIWVLIVNLRHEQI